MVEVSRATYAALYGATTGDQVRLGDTDLWIQVEQDFTVGGEEAVFGGGKSVRESMAQGMTTRAEGALDTVITNALVLDWWGVVKADVGIREGRIVALGRAGNADIADGVHPDLAIGASTDVIAGEGKILTAGAIDAHVHLISPSQLHEALATGITTVAGGGTGPSEGSKATTVTPGAWHLAQIHRALDAVPVNLLLLAKGNTVSAGALAEQALGGAAGFKVHEDWGSTPAAVDASLTAAEEWGLAGRAALRLAQRGGFRRLHPGRDRGALDPRLPRRGRRRRPCPGHLVDRRRAPRHPGLDEPDAPAHRQHGGRAPRHADGLPPPVPRRAGGPRVRGVPDPGHDHRRRGPAARHGRPVDHLLRRPGDGTDR